MLGSLVMQTSTASETLDRFLAMSQGARDALAGALVLAAILLAGWLIAFAVSWIVKHLLRVLRFNDGMRGLVGHPVLGVHEPAAVAAWAVYWLLMFATLVVAFDALGLDVGPSLAARLRDVLPRVLAATILLAGGALVAIGMGTVTRRFFD